MKNTFVAKKHWIHYGFPILFIYFGLSVLNRFSIEMMLFSFVLLALGVIRLLQVSSVKWTFNGEYLIVQRGILPWARTHMEVPVYDIYESLVSVSMFGHFLAYGNLTVRRTDGVTTQLYERGLVGARELSARINSAVREVKSNKNVVVSSVVAPASRSISEELKHLVELKESGHITQSEYENLKSKILG